MAKSTLMVVDETGEIIEEENTVSNLSAMFKETPADVYASESIHMDDSIESRYTLHKMRQSPDYRLADEKGKEISITGFICQMVQVKNRVTGEKEKAPRVILVDTDGKGHACVSNGVLNALSAIVQDVGQPSVNLPFTVKVGSGKTDKGEFLTLTLIKIK